MSSDSLRILRVTSSTYPEVVGGVGLHVHHLSRVQAEMGHDVTVLTSDNGDRSLPSEERRDGYRLLRHRELARPLDNSIVPGVAATLHEFVDDYDVLHIHSHLYFSSTLAALFGRRTDIPVVVTNHGLVSQTAPRWIQRLYNPTVGKFTFETGDRILCYTETDKQRLQERGIDTPISVVPNGIDCSWFRPSAADPSDQLLFVGRLKEGKGPQYLLEAFGRLASDYPDYSLQLVGDGPLREELEAQASTLGIADRVSFRGEVPNDELPALYADSRAFVLPSRSEGLPRTVLEAMACGRPVVTSDLPQLRPLVEDVGYTFETGSVDRLVDTLTTVLDADDDRLDRFGTRARKRVESTYSWEDTVERTVAEYYDVLGERTTGSGIKRSLPRQSTAE